VSWHGRDDLPPGPSQQLLDDGFELPGEPQGTHLFATGPRWRSQLQPTLSLESGGDPHAPDWLATNATLTLRIFETVELGGGVLQLFRPGFSGGPALAYGGFGRLGLVFHLGRQRRVSLPWGVDLGGVTGGGSYFKMNLGVRVKLTESLFVGLYPYNPVFTGRREASSPWSFPTTIELGWDF
jgi:hypothetical protein